MNYEQTPILTEPGVKYFLGETLKNCHKQKKEYNFYLINTGFFIVFMIIVSCYLFYKYKTRPTKKEKEKTKKLKRDYFVTKVRQMQTDKAKLTNIQITNLPKFESPFEVLHKNFYKT